MRFRYPSLVTVHLPLFPFPLPLSLLIAFPIKCFCSQSTGSKVLFNLSSIFSIPVFSCSPCIRDALVCLFMCSFSSLFPSHIL